MGTLDGTKDGGGANLYINGTEHECRPNGTWGQAQFPNGRRRKHLDPGDGGLAKRRPKQLMAASCTPQHS